MASHGLVIVGFDGSPESWTALDYAATEAVLRGHRVRLVHALLDARAYASTALVSPVEDPPTEARRLLTFARHYLRDKYGIKTAEVYIADRPAAALLTGEAHAADLVVVGRRGRGQLPAGIGSVSLHVAAHAACPVAVVTAAAPAVTGPVVLGVDAADPVPAAFGYAFDAAERHGSAVHARYVWHPDPAPGTAQPCTAEDARRVLAETIEEWREAYPEVPVDVAVLPGRDAAAALVHDADGASLLVVGCREQTRWQRLLHGSVSGAVIRAATVPVVVTHTATVPVPADL